MKGLGAGDALSARFRRRSDEVYDRALALARLDAVFNPVLEMLPLLGIAAVLWIGGRQVIDGTLQLGSFVAFNAYVVMLVWPLRMLGQRVTTLQKALAASGRITEVLEAEPRLRDPRHPETLERPVRGDVRLDDVRFGHEGDHAVLDGLDLHVAPGESLALVGATGSGKSTVAGLLARLYDPEDGRVLLDGHDLRELRIVDVRSAVALVFEETFLFSESVRENIRARAAGRRRHRGRARGVARGRSRVHRQAPGRLRHHSRRARVLALGRTAPADRDRTRDPGRPRGARPGRRHLRGRRDEGARDPRRARRGDARAHDARDRPPAGDDRARRPRGRARGRADRRGRGTHAELLRRSARYRALLALEVEAA